MKGIDPLRPISGSFHWARQLAYVRGGGVSKKGNKWLGDGGIAHYTTQKFCVKFIPGQLEEILLS